MNYFKNKKIVVTGGAGFLGFHVVTRLLESAYDIEIPRSYECDLRKLNNCIELTVNKDVVIHLAGNVGGIGYNQKNPGTLFYDNLMMGVNIIEACRINQVKKVVIVGTICSYPKFTKVPFKEDDLWNGYPEETNAPYGIAKKSLLVMAQAYRQQYGMNIIYLMPVNLYGPGDNFNEESSHVIPALIQKIEEAKKLSLPSIEVWGTGEASREFLYIDDCAEAIILATEKYNKPDPINIGYGKEIKIKDLVITLCDLIGYNGKIVWNKSKPDGQPRRLLDTSKAKKEFGFKAKTDFLKGLEETIMWYNNYYD